MTARLSQKLMASAVSVALVAAPTAALASDANRNRDLVGEQARYGTDTLDQRGFTYITGHEGDYDTKHTYWWHSGDKNCLHVETYDGKFTAITDASKKDCNQGDGDVGTALAVGAGVALLGALLAGGHKESHHEDGKHYSSQDDEDYFDSGYYDGLHNEPYHNPHRADAYAKGYESGVDQRNRNTSHNTGRGGYNSAVKVADIKGRDSIWAIDEMSNRGFRSVDSFSSGDTQYGIYWRPDSRQCVQITNADGRVYDIRDIGTHPKCR